jgi:hypothetical protein
VTPLLATPLTVTTTGPVVALDGTGTVIEVVLQLAGVAALPLNVTVLDPCVAPKFEPLIVIVDPRGPDGGDKLLIEAGAETTIVVVDARQLLFSLDSAITPGSSAQAPR